MKGRVIVDGSMERKKSRTHGQNNARKLTRTKLHIRPPGSGKTTAIVSFANQARHFGRKFRVVTYSRSLSQELKARIGCIKNDEGKEVSPVYTLHSYGHHVLGLTMADYVNEFVLKSFCKKYNIEYEVSFV